MGPYCFENVVAKNKGAGIPGSLLPNRLMG